MTRTESALINNKKCRRKIVLLFVCVAIFTTVCSFYKGTYASFSNKTTSNVVVTSSKTEDIIKNIEIQCYEDKCKSLNSNIEDDVYINPMYIKLLKSDDISFTPVIYFSVEGDALNYILNVNPVKPQNPGNEVKVPIKLKLTPSDLVNLLTIDKDYPVEGQIVVKYLNEYINIPKKIKFSKEYLLYNYLLDANNRNDFNNLINSNFNNDNMKKNVNLIINNNNEIKDLMDKQDKK